MTLIKLLMLIAAALLLAIAAWIALTQPESEDCQLTPAAVEAIETGDRSDRDDATNAVTDENMRSLSLRRR